MGRDIGQFTTRAGVDGQRDFMGFIAEKCVERGFTVDFDNREETSQTISTTVTMDAILTYANNFLIHTNTTFTVPLMQMRLKSPCGRIFFHLLPLVVGQGLPDGLSMIISGVAGIGNSTSFNSTILCYVFGPSGYNFDYELLYYGTGFSCLITRPGATVFTFGYGQPVPLAPNLPGVSSAGLANTTVFLDAASTSISGFYGQNAVISDNGVTRGSEASRFLPSQSTPIKRDIIDVETAIIPVIWTATMCYAFENVFHGRTTYAQSVISGVVELNGVTYRVLLSTADGFICYRF